MNSRRGLYAVVAIFGLALAAGAIGLVTYWQSQKSRIDPGNAAQVAMGREVYANWCASCHGGNLEGQPDWQKRKPNGRLPAPPHDASGHTWHHPDQQLLEITKQGVSAVVPGYQSDMPGFQGMLSDEQITAVLSFIQSRWPAEIRSRQQALTRTAS